MARGVTKRFMGLQDYNTNPNRRDAFQPNLWHRSSHPSWSGNHQPREGVLWRRKQRQSTKAEPGLPGWSQRPSLLEDDQVPVEDGWVLQPEGKAQKIQYQRSRPSKSDTHNEGPSTRQIRTNLGRTLQSRPLLSLRKLPPRGYGWKQATSSMECWAPKEVLRIRITA